ncbi:MAG: two-component sensor histidine kinase [Rhodopseudomonas sp.]|nr:two-component sensor histidine kinase [Rhodopseudomonas sp.]
MDGHQAKLTDSLRIRLSLWLSLAILAVALAAGAFSFVSAYREAHELQDDVLRQIARLFDQRHLPLAHSGDSGRLANSDEESRVVVEYLDTPSRSGSAFGTKPRPDNGPVGFPATLSDGLQTFVVRDEPYRVLVKTLSSGDRIAVAQETSFRDEIARDSALRTTMPLLVLVPVLLLVTADLIRRMFAPVTTLAGEIDRRSEHALHPFDARPLPAEIRPFVSAINRLLGRVAEAMNAQRRFVANAAHELRSPMTALSLQAERLAQADMSDVARDRLATLRKGIERGRGLLDQLLSLARAQMPSETRSDALSVHHVFRSVLENLMPLAETKAIDVGVTGQTNRDEADLMLAATQADLTSLVQNLVDNAIRYTPAGGRVDLSARRNHDRVVITVADNGPGIPPDEMTRVFDPFYRIPGQVQTGSGLGLSIVKTIADRIGASITLAPADSRTGRGLAVSVAIPRGT